MSTARFKVTMLASDNTYLTYPVDGEIELLELGTNGSIIHAVFRRSNPDGTPSAPVEVRRPHFTYGAALR